MFDWAPFKAVASLKAPWGRCHSGAAPVAVQEGRCLGISWSYSATLSISPDVWSPFCFEIVLSWGQSSSGLAPSQALMSSRRA